MPRCEAIIILGQGARNEDVLQKLLSAAGSEPRVARRQHQYLGSFAADHRHLPLRRSTTRKFTLCVSVPSARWTGFRRMTLSLESTTLKPCAISPRPRPPRGRRVTTSRRGRRTARGVAQRRLCDVHGCGCSRNVSTSRSPLFPRHHFSGCMEIVDDFDR
jgi:hypothetical protein